MCCCWLSYFLGRALFNRDYFDVVFYVIRSDAMPGEMHFNSWTCLVWDTRARQMGTKRSLVVFICCIFTRKHQFGAFVKTTYAINQRVGITVIKR